MSVYEVIVGNVGSVYHGKSRTTALETYESYVRNQQGTRRGSLLRRRRDPARRWRDRAGAHGSSERRVTQAAGLVVGPAPSPDTGERHIKIARPS